MKLLLLATLLASFPCVAQTQFRTSGNPLFPGWYADPAAAFCIKQY